MASDFTNTAKVMQKFRHKMIWATFRALFSKKHLVTLFGSKVNWLEKVLRLNRTQHFP
jgi:hypothetical protein